MKAFLLFLKIQLVAASALGDAMSLKQAVKESARDRAAAAATFHANHIETKVGHAVARSDKESEDEAGRSTASERDEDFDDEDLDLDFEE